MTHPNVTVKALADGEVELVIYDQIGERWGEGVSAKHVSDLLKDHGQASKISVRLNSPGGDVFQGFTIYNLLKQHAAKVIVHIDGLAASAASVVAMAGDEIRIAENAFLMIHDPYTFVGGTADDLRDSADRLDKIALSIAKTYANRSGQTVAAVASLMADETWFTADDAVDRGFADTVTEDLEVAACLRPEHLEQFRNAPKALTETKGLGTIIASELRDAIARQTAITLNDTTNSAPTAAPDPQAPVAATPSENDTMKSLLIALNLSADADEASAIAAITKLKEQASLAAELETITGKQGAEAIGAVRAMSDAAAERDELRAELDKVEGDKAQEAFGALLKDAQEGDEKQLTPAMAKYWQDRFDGAEDKAKLSSELKGYLAVAAPVLPKNIKQAEGSTGSATVTHDGNGWSDMKPAARAALKRENPELYNAMRADAKRRGLIV